MQLTSVKLKKILKTDDNVNGWVEALNKYMPKFNINNLNRISAFLSQTAYESCNYNKLEENLNYSAERLLQVFPKYFNLSNFKEYDHNPEKIANHVYANRMGNGNEESGDGWKYRGRGLIQITGKSNYEYMNKKMDEFMNLLPDDCSSMYFYEFEVLTACCWWNDKKLNELADDDAISVITKIINGGLNGIEERKKRYNEVKEILKQEPIS